MSNVVRIAGIQSARREQDSLAVEKGLLLAEQAAKAGAKIICFGEFMIDTESGLFGPLFGKFRSSAKANGIYIITSLITPVERRIYSVLIDPQGRVSGIYEKIHGGRGASLPVFKTKWCKIGMMICYDLTFPEVARAYALQGAEIVFCPTASSYPDDDNFLTCLKARAIENSIFVAGINRVGGGSSEEYGDSKIYYRGVYYNFGKSTVWGPNGQVLAQANSIDESLVMADLDLDVIRRMRLPGGESPQTRAPILSRNKRAYSFNFKVKTLTKEDVK